MSPVPPWRVPRDWMPGLRALLPLYAAIWTCTTAGFVAINSVTEDTSFLVLAEVPLTIGFIVSLRMRLAGASRRVLPLMMAVAGLAVAGLIRTNAAANILPGVSSALVVSMLPAVGLAWFLVAFSFCLIEDDLLLFMLPPTLTILGLCGTENPNADMMAYFIIFVVASIFALSYQSYLRHVPAQEVGRSSEGVRQVLHWQLASAAVVFALVAIVTAVVSVPLKQAGRLGMYRFGMAGSFLFGALGDYGYNAMGREIRIGQGTPALSERVVMRVKSPEGAYWRARAYNDYTGHGWVDDAAADTRYPTLAPDGTCRLEVTRLEGVRRVVMPQTFTFAESWPSGALPAAADPVLFQFQGNPVPMRVSENLTVMLAGRQRVDAGARYDVESRVLHVPPGDLRACPRPQETGDPLLTQYVEPYLVVPNSAYRVKDLALQVTARETNNFDRARAIASYLSENYVYNLNVTAVPKGEDAVTHFLFTAHEGYCEMFASAMVIMCRFAGVPARLAAGFATGDLDPDTGEYVVREADAHAWVEVYFRKDPRLDASGGYGWVTFDPTPGSRDAITNQIRKGGVLFFLKSLIRRLTFPVLVTIALVAAGINLLWLTLLGPWHRHRVLLRSLGSGPCGRVLGAYYTACERLRRRVPRRPSQTPAEYCRAVSERLPSVPWLPHLDALTTAFSAARFGAEPVSDEQAAQAEAHLSALRAGLKRKTPRALPVVKRA